MSTNKLTLFYRQHLRWRWRRWQNNRLMDRLALQIARQRAPLADMRPAKGPKAAEESQTAEGSQTVVLFNASTRLGGLSLNAAYQLLVAWGLRLQGVPVVHFVCRAGLLPCPLGTRRDRPTDPPPCRECIAQSVHVYRGADVRWLLPERATEWSQTNNPDLELLLQDLDVDRLSGFTYRDYPLGRMVLPTLRWVLRRHHLIDDGDTRMLFRRYIHSAWQVVKHFAALLDEVDPQAVVVFNGMFYPEAAARYVAQQRGVRVITHEVGFQPFSAFFTPGEATAYPVEIPPDFLLSPAQEQRLEQYLAKRFQGDFSMAGIRFWPGMHPLSPDLLQKMAQFRQVVPVFTNVIFDTSQPHSNVTFEHMFAWLDLVLEMIRGHPETLFILRAHPDESRPGKESCESVRQWVQDKRVVDLPNVVFIDASQPFSSYELIQRSKFVMVYNSTIGLEASLLGAAVLCGGRARYTPYRMVFSPITPEAYRQQAEEFLAAEHIDVPPEFSQNARRFLYFQLYRTSLPFQSYLTSEDRPGYVYLRDFTWNELMPEKSPVMRVVLAGILKGQPFLYDDDRMVNENRGGASKNE